MALFQWREQEYSPPPAPVGGDKRVVTRLVFLRKVAGEWRAFGVERIRQSYEIVGIYDMEIRYGWRDVEWMSA